MCRMVLYPWVNCTGFRTLNPGFRGSPLTHGYKTDPIMIHKRVRVRVNPVGVREVNYTHKTSVLECFTLPRVNPRIRSLLSAGGGGGSPCGRLWFLLAVSCVVLCCSYSSPDISGYMCGARRVVHGLLLTTHTPDGCPHE